MGLREREKVGKGLHKGFHTSCNLANQRTIAKPSQTLSCTCNANTSSLPMVANPPRWQTAAMLLQ